MAIIKKSAGALIYCAEYGKIKFLILKYPTYWGFAKGVIEEKESEKQAAKREVKEETNLDIDFINGFEARQTWFFKLNKDIIKKEAVFYLAKISSEEAKKVKISSEHEDFTWKTYEEALKILKIKQNKEMLKKASEFIAEYEKQKKLF